jgi:membrane protease YdiL (CAAX protease family)
MKKKSDLINGVQRTVLHFWKRLKETPILLVWLIIGPLVAYYLHGGLGLIFGVINIGLLGLYAFVIRQMTQKPVTPVEVKRPGVELIISLVMLVFFILVQLFDFDVLRVQPVYGWVKLLLQKVYIGVNDWAIFPEWIKQDVFLAVSSSIKKLIPTILVLFILGYRCAGMGFTKPHWRLTGILVASTALFGILTGLFSNAPLWYVPLFYLVGIFVNALPEELFFRGFLLSRLEKANKNPLNALVISAILFNLMHVPISIYHGTTLGDSLLSIISIGYPIGLIWGYLYMRTRSIFPGVFWHAANGNLGFMMMSF